MKGKPINTYRRGNSDHYRRLQEKSMRSRITRRIVVEVVRDPKKVTSVPTRKRLADAGFDLSSCEAVTIKPGQIATVSTGVKICCPNDYYYLMLGRSSMNLRGLINITGVIDAGYQGELKIMLHNTTDKTQKIEIGERVGQIVFFPQIHPTFSERAMFSSETDRGSQGWGSSGK